MSTMRYIVRDVGESIAFYVDSLGFAVLEQYGPAMAIVRLGDCDLWLAGPLSSAARPMPDGTTPAPGGWNRVVLPVEDIEASVAALRVKGCRVRSEIIRVPGGLQTLIEDPSGNCIELFQSV